MRDVGQSAIHVIRLCICDVIVKRCYCSICILYECSLDESLLLRRATRNNGEVIRRSSGPGSVVGVATAYGLDGPGIESRWGEIFRTSPDRR